MPSTVRSLRFPTLVVTLLVALLGSLVATAPVASAATRAERITQAKNIALRQIGDPYRYGAAGPDRFDCSGLVYYSTHRAGFTGVPRTSSAQAAHMRRIPKSRMRPGDFLFFYDGGGVYHAAIFVGWRDGHRVMVHSPGSGKRVGKARPWTTRWYAGTLR